MVDEKKETEGEKKETKKEENPQAASKSKVKTTGTKTRKAKSNKSGNFYVVVVGTVVKDKQEFKQGEHVILTEQEAVEGLAYGTIKKL